MISKNYKAAFLIGILVFLFSPSCQEKKEVDERREKLLSLIDEKESQIRTQIEQVKQPDLKIAMETVEAYRNFIYHYSGDSLAPFIHFRMARLFDGVFNDKAQAILEYDRIYAKYPEFPERAMLIFFEGNAFQDLGDTTHAIEKFELFIAKYPNHDFADDARGLIDMIRMDPAEFEKRFLSDQDSAS
jgi:tetratricopeptide (TPR) repeat protein